jgi:hypothetical protein
MAKLAASHRLQRNSGKHFMACVTLLRCPVCQSRSALPCSAPSHLVGRSLPAVGSYGCLPGPIYPRRCCSSTRTSMAI